MATARGFQKRFAVFAILFAFINRMVTWFLPSDVHANSTSFVAPRVSKSLLIRLSLPGRVNRELDATHALELKSSFPFVHLRRTPVSALAIDLAFASYASEIGLPELTTILFPHSTVESNSPPPCSSPTSHPSPPPPPPPPPPPGSPGEGGVPDSPPPSCPFMYDS
jgi:hypothetical protein